MSQLRRFFELITRRYPGLAHDFRAELGAEIHTTQVSPPPSSPEHSSNSLSEENPPQSPESSMDLDTPPVGASSPAAHPQPPSSSSSSSSSGASSSEDEAGFTEVTSRKRISKAPKAPKAKKAPVPAPAQDTSPAQPVQPPLIPGDTSPPPQPATAPSVPSQARTEKPPPPIFLQDKAKWDRVQKICDLKKIAFTHARNTALGIKITVPDSSNFRALRKALTSEHIGCFSYPLEEEKVLRAVIRGLPKEVTCDDISQDLKSQGFPVENIRRLYNKRDKTPYDLVMVTLPHNFEGKKIFKLTACCKISGLRVEAPHKDGMPGQCHNCQTYGHSSFH